jgi:hypothetical protein
MKNVKRLSRAGLPLDSKGWRRIERPQSSPS